MDTPAVSAPLLQAPLPEALQLPRPPSTAHRAGPCGQHGEPGHEPPPDLVCSARGCPHPAGFGLLWNNPSLHTPERRKTWLACPEHRQHLVDFLGVRGFLREVVGVDELSTP